MTALPEPTAVELLRLSLVGLGCSEENLRQDHYERLLQLAASPVGGKMIALPGGFTACREYGKLILMTPKKSSVADKPAPCLVEESRSHGHEAVPLRIPGQTPFAGWQIEASVLDRNSLSAA